MNVKGGVFLRLSGLALWMAFLLIVSLHSSPPQLDFSLVSWDKFQHAAAYAVLTVFAGRVFLCWLKRTTAWMLAFAAAVVYGGLLEIAQGSFTAVRSPEWGDLAADAVGAGAALLFVWFLRAVGPRSERL